MSIDVLLFIVFVCLYIQFKIVEVSFGELNINEIKFAVEEENPKAVILLKNIGKMDMLQSSMQFCYISCFVFSTYYGNLVFDDLVHSGFIMEEYKFLIKVVSAIAFVMVMFTIGNVFGQKVGTKHSFETSYRWSKVVTVISYIFSPILFPCLYIGNGLSKLFGMEFSENRDSITEEKIRILVGVGEGEGTIDEAEKEMINNIFEFDNTIVGDIATHRTDIVAVSVAASLKDILSVVKEEKFSRIPVYNENIDDIVGFFRVRDLLKFYTEGKKDASFSLKNILFEAYFVPFSKKTDELFEDMQKNKLQMAIVIDEYGGTAGIVTMEDLIEEIVGNIFDEYDVEEEEITKIDENTYLIKGTTGIDDVEDCLDVDFEEGEDYDTIGGFIIGQLGRIPEDGEKPDIRFKNLVLNVEKIYDKRIELIKIQRIQEIVIGE